MMRSQALSYSAPAVSEANGQAISLNRSLTQDPLFLPVVFGSICMVGYLINKALDRRGEGQPAVHIEAPGANASLDRIHIGCESWLTGLAKLVLACGITKVLIDRTFR